MNQPNPGLEGKACLEIHERIPLFRSRQEVFDRELGDVGNRTEIEMGSARECAFEQQEKHIQAAVFNN